MAPSSIERCAGARYYMTSAAREHKARDWLRTAAKDLKAAQNMLAAGDQFEPYHVCFWAQQAAEKAFKAALIFSAQPFDPTHDLNDLADLLPDDWQARRVVGRLRQLTEYAVETRYPDARAMPTRDDARQAVQQAAAIFRSISRDLQARGFPPPKPPKPSTGVTADKNTLDNIP